MAEVDTSEFDKEYEEFIANLKASNGQRPPMPPARPRPPCPNCPPHPDVPDWYDGYDHHMHHHHHHRPYICLPDKEKEKYGFNVEVGGKYYTGGTAACCPIKITVKKVTAETIYYTDKNGVEHQKSYHDFMTSSWRDKSL